LGAFSGGLLGYVIFDKDGDDGCVPAVQHSRVQHRRAVMVLLFTGP
jgi:hypothetical protein